MTPLPEAPAELAEIESQIVRLIVRRDDLIQETQLSRREPSDFSIENLPSIAEPEERIHRDVRKIRARSGSAKVAKEEADRIEKLRQDKKKKREGK